MSSRTAPATRPAGLGLRTEIATAGIAILAVLLFRRVFDSWKFLPLFLAAALLPLAIGAAGRRLRLPVSLAVLASVLGAVLYFSWTLFLRTTVVGIPWRATLTTARTTMRETWAEVPTAISPVPTTTGYLLLAGLGIWMLAVAADLLAVSWELPLVGLLPWTSLVAVIGAVGTPDRRAVFSLVFVAAAFVYLGTCSVDERRRRSRPLRVDGRRAGSPVRGIGIAGATLVLTFVLAPSVPGFGAPPLVKYKTGVGPGDRVAISPLVDIRSRLQRQPALDVFNVRADRPDYWRVLALDRFDGTVWGSNGSYREIGSGLPRGDGNPPSVRLDQTFLISGLEQFWLPAAYVPVTVSAPETRVDPRTLTLATDRATGRGLGYQVRSEVPRPAPEELRAAAGPDPEIIRQDLALPGGFPESIRRETQRVVNAARATSRYEQARALQDYFRTSGLFTYSLDVPAGHDSQTLERFLFATRTGYCEQYAGTMAAMARSIGIPARVAVGFTAGRFDPGIQLFFVTSENAHAWVEIWFPGYGWLRFDPTPGRFDPNDANYNGTFDPSTLPDRTPDANTATSSTLTGTAPGVPTTRLPDDTDLGAGKALRQPPTNRARNAAIVLGILVAIPALFGSAVYTVKLLRRRRRLRVPGALAQGLWLEVVDLLTDLRFEASSGETALEFARRAAQRFSVAESVLVGLARAEYAEMFSSGPDAADGADGSVRKTEEEIRSDILSGLVLLERMRAYTSLASLRSRGPRRADIEMVQPFWERSVTSGVTLRS